MGGNLERLLEKKRTISAKDRYIMEMHHTGLELKI